VLLEEIKRHPGEITLIALGPLFNIGAAIDRDPATFRKLHRVVMMGGSIDRGYDGARMENLKRADAEWNINRDPRDAAKLLAASGCRFSWRRWIRRRFTWTLPIGESVFAAGNAHYRSVDAALSPVGCACSLLVRAGITRYGACDPLHLGGLCRPKLWKRNRPS
jgi:hypothetical protein